MWKGKIYISMFCVIWVFFFGKFYKVLLGIEGIISLLSGKVKWVLLFFYKNDNFSVKFYLRDKCYCG